MTIIACILCLNKGIYCIQPCEKGPIKNSDIMAQASWVCKTVLPHPQPCQSIGNPCLQCLCQVGAFSNSFRPQQEIDGHADNQYQQALYCEHTVLPFDLHAATHSSSSSDSNVGNSSAIFLSAFLLILQLWRLNVQYIHEVRAKNYNNLLTQEYATDDIRL